MNAKELKEMTVVIAKYMGMTSTGYPYSGAFSPAGDDSKFAQFVNDQMKGEEWYIYPKFDESYDWIMFVVEKINKTHNAGIVARDNMYTIQLLLVGGYVGDSTIKLPSLTMTIENLFSRCANWIVANKLI